MHKVFSTQLNPENSPQKQKRRLSTLQASFTSNKKQLSDYVNSLDTKVNSTVIQQLSHLKIKHLELGGVLSGLQAERTKILKNMARKQQDFKESFQQYLMKDIERFKNHKEFFKKHFVKFSTELNEAVEKRDKLLICVSELRKTLKQLKRIQIRKATEEAVLPTITQLRTSKTIRTTQPTQRSIRISTDIFEPLSPLSPILMRMGGSQPVLGSRIHQPIKAQSSSSKKEQRKQNIQLLKSLFEQYYKQNKQRRNIFEKVLFQRRNYAILMEFFNCLECN